MRRFLPRLLSLALGLAALSAQAAPVVAHVTLSLPDGSSLIAKRVDLSAPQQLRWESLRQMPTACEPSARGGEVKITYSTMAEPVALRLRSDSDGALVATFTSEKLSGGSVGSNPNSCASFVKPMRLERSESAKIAWRSGSALYDLGDGVTLNVEILTPGLDGKSNPR